MLNEEIAEDALTIADTERSYHTMDKTGWGEGLWLTEPDKCQWRDEATGLPCLAVRSFTGSWCGYVGVPAGHRFYRSPYTQLDVEVHGGLTYSDPCEHGEPEESGICHVPAARESDDVWWLGFDCHHAYDYAPGHASRGRALGAEIGKPELFARQAYEVYRDLDYVRAEIAGLARQVA